jgi:hypothetical protein
MPSFNANLTSYLVTIQVSHDLVDAVGESSLPGHSHFLSHVLQLGGPEADATADLLVCTNKVVTQELDCLEDHCMVVEAANITRCANGAPSPAPASDIYLSPNQGMAIAKSTRLA